MNPVLKLLRSTINLGKDDPDLLRINMSRLAAATFTPPEPWARSVFQFVKGHFNHHLECPSIQTVRDYFESIDDIEVLECIKDIQTTPLYGRTDFAALLDNWTQEQLNVRVATIALEAKDIAIKGRTVKNGRNSVTQKGARDALAFLAAETSGIVLGPGDLQSRGELRRDAPETWEDYLAAEADRHKAVGRFVGIEEIDTVCRGVKKGELWIHAAFPGELKTSLALTWSYNLATRYRTNVLYVSLEMTRRQILRALHVMHSASKRWGGRTTLDYRRVRDGELTREDKAVLKDCIDDLTTNPEYCSLDLWCPDHDVTVAEIRQHAEQMNRKKEVGMIIIDHGGLVGFASKWREYTVGLNSVVRDSKKLALQFNHGAGVPVLMLFQINRQGKDSADEHGGRYKMSALSYANEAERSADVITTTYLNDEHRANGTTLLGNLKNRDNPLFKAFVASVNFGCRYISGSYHGAVDQETFTEGDL